MLSIDCEKFPVKHRYEIVGVGAILGDTAFFSRRKCGITASAQAGRRSWFGSLLQRLLALAKQHEAEDPKRVICHSTGPAKTDPLSTKTNLQWASTSLLWGRIYPELKNLRSTDRLFDLTRGDHLN